MWFANEKINQIIFWYILTFSTSLIIWGNVFVTLSCIALISFWIFEGKYKSKITLLISRRTPIFFLAIFFVSFIWAVWQLPSEESFNDILEYLPLFILPLVLGSRKRLTHNQFHVLALLYVFSIVANTLFNFIYFLLTAETFTDIRTISNFMSYIRLSLYSVIGVVVSIYYLLYSTRVNIGIKEKVFLSISFLWLVFFVVILSSITGYISLLFLSILLAISQFKKQQHIILKILPSAIIIICLYFFIQVVLAELKYFTHPDKIVPEKIEQITLLGNEYKPFDNTGRLENGHWVNLYVCEKELAENWNQYSNYSLYGRDDKNHPLFSTLKRYMTSKNLRKDASGLKQLSKEDIALIEAGCTNYRFANNLNISHRLYEIFWEFHHYLQGKNPAGHSVTQRIEFLKTAKAVFKNHFWFGTGPAHISTELHAQYAQMKRKLPQNYWGKPHNQFMLIAVQYGIIGLAIFIISLIGIILFSTKLNMLSVSWICISGISFLNEDTLDGLNGLVFFAFFGCLFLFSQPLEQKSHIDM